MSCDSKTLINAAYAAGWAKLSVRLLKESIAVSSSASNITTVLNGIYSAGYPKMSIRDVMEGQVSQSCASGTGCTATTVESMNATNGYSKLSTGDLVRAKLAEACSNSSPALTCHQFIAQTVHDAAYFSSLTPSQFLQITSTVVACQIKVFVDDSPAGAPVSCVFTFRTASNKGGAVLGTTQTVATTGLGGQWLTLNFSSNPTISSDCFLTLESVSDTITWGFNTAGGYDGTTYCVYLGAGPDPTSDFAFEVWTMQ